MRGRGNGSSHGFGTRCGGALLGFGDALIVAKLLAVGLGGRERGLGAGRDRIALVLGASGEDMNRKLRGRRVVAANKVDLAVHQHCNERQVAAEPIELGDDELRPVLLAGGQRLFQLGPIVAACRPRSRVNSSSNVHLPPSR